MGPPGKRSRPLGAIPRAAADRLCNAIGTQHRRVCRPAQLLDDLGHRLLMQHPPIIGPPRLARSSWHRLVVDPSAEPAMSAITIPLASIKDGGAQMRVEMHPETVDDYAADMLDGAVFPPVIVFHDGTDYWLADGFHRVEATRKIDHEEIEAEIREGTSRDAILYGIGAERDARPPAHPGGQAARGRAIADRPRMGALVGSQDRRAAKVDHKTVGKIRRELSGEIPTPKADEWGIPHPDRQAERTRVRARRRSPTIPDDLLIAECRRRGLTVEASGCLTMNRSRRSRRPSGGRSRICSRWHRSTTPSMRASVTRRAANGLPPSGPSTPAGSHLRRLHYQLVSPPERFGYFAGRQRVPEHGKRLDLSCTASLAARYLDRIPFDGLIDRRNDEPMIFAEAQTRTPT